MIKSFLEKHGDYRSDRKFSEMTTVKMGGDIAHYVEPYNLDDLREIISFLKANMIPFKVLGNGSNMICGSSTYEGVVISLKHFDNYELSNDRVYVEAGVLAPYFAIVTAKNGLSGLEFASGIPGTIGGLIYMNAGAYKREMADIVEEVIVLRRDEIVTLKKEDLKFSYRYSIFKEHPRWVIIGAYLKMEEGNSEEIMQLIADRASRRKESQPLDKPSAGSCFRNPENMAAWKLIDDVGLRGYEIGGAKVSEKHSNFLINNGNGKGEDYLALALKIQEEVKEKFNVKLTMEVEKFNC
ncbi:MAG: UDP-N-acetylmuramate dehydrogenase [Erysipelotrichaceae bacterium]|nr:UDP-N-acetylmuramate dehydrogenase [Erysipelotrichaceae bacterium]